MAPSITPKWFQFFNCEGFFTFIVSFFLDRFFSQIIVLGIIIIIINVIIESNFHSFPVPILLNQIKLR